MIQDLLKDARDRMGKSIEATRHELATVRIDDSLPRGDIVLRDVAGASPSEIVTLVKAAYGTPRNPGLV